MTQIKLTLLNELDWIYAENDGELYCGTCGLTRRAQGFQLIDIDRREVYPEDRCAECGDLLGGEK